jgi:hypothetical protein
MSGWLKRARMIGRYLGWGLKSEDEIERQEEMKRFRMRERAGIVRKELGWK